MSTAGDRPFEALERIFHEPNRLAIMSALCATNGGLSFVDLKEECRLTDGNLNRHLKVLQEAQAVEVRKSFVHGKPRTTIHLSQAGAARFGEYLAALREVLEQAVRDLPAATRRTAPLPVRKLARA